MRARLRPEPATGLAALCLALLVQVGFERYAVRLARPARWALGLWLAMVTIATFGATVVVAGPWVAAGNRVFRRRDVLRVRYRSMPRALPDRRPAVIELTDGSGVDVHDDPFTVARVLGVPCVSS